MAAYHLSAEPRGTRDVGRGPMALAKVGSRQDEHEEEGGYASDLPIKVKTQKLQRCVVKTFFVASEANGKADEQGKGIAAARTVQEGGARGFSLQLIVLLLLLLLLLAFILIPKSKKFAIAITLKTLNA